MESQIYILETVSLCKMTKITEKEGVYVNTVLLDVKKESSLQWP